jgi:ubiquinone/menaquinone biosynthesis C-methylase UbiE
MPAVYDKLASYYDRAFAPLERRFLGRMRAETLALLPIDAVTLELGAGTGANFEFYPATRQAIASELSIKMIEIARGKAGPIALVQADAQNLPFPANHFDAAFATLVFCSIPSPDLAFAELIRTVKSGGRVVLLEHVRPAGLLGYFFDLLNVVTVALVDDHFNRRTADTAESSGLKIIEIRRRLFGIVNLIVCETPAL